MSTLLSTYMLRTGDGGIATNFSLLEGAPKSKFLFTAEFQFRNGNVDKGNEQREIIKYALKTAGRPSPQYNYEDVNFYNYRTQVLTKVTYGTVTIGLYDDAPGLALNLYKAYMSELSPAASATAAQAGSLSKGNATSVAPLQNKYGVIDHIKVHHYFANGGGTSGGQTTFTYLNPKIQTITMDELDMSSSEPSTIQITFVYDSVNVEEK